MQLHVDSEMIRIFLNDLGYTLYTMVIIKGYRTSLTFIFVWSNSSMHSDELVSWNAAVCPYTK